MENEHEKPQGRLDVLEHFSAFFRRELEQKERFRDAFFAMKKEMEELKGQLAQMKTAPNEARRIKRIFEKSNAKNEALLESVQTKNVKLQAKIQHLELKIDMLCYKT